MGPGAESIREAQEDPEPTSSKRIVPLASRIPSVMLVGFVVGVVCSLGLTGTIVGTSRPSANMRRNSLSDLNMRRNTSSGGGLRIPARISQAQQGLRRDLGLVREFAGSVNGMWHQ